MDPDTTNISTASNSLNTYCPLCQSEGTGFTPLPDVFRVNAEKFGYVHFGHGEMTALESYSCSRCGASDRERIYAYWLQNFYAQQQRHHAITTIHFAPENGLSAYLKSSGFFSNYQTADIMMDNVDHKADLMHLPFPDASYDFFICSHVLEHVDDDIASIAELFRITKKGGSGILMAPIVVGLKKTIEDPTITDEGERWRLFGQNDHVRLYSHDDYVSRIEASGFKLQQLDRDFFGDALFKELGLKDTTILYIASKI